MRRNLLLFGYLTGIALIVLLLPARFTAPARIVFTEAVGPAEGLVFEAAGDILATTGTLRDAFLARERDRMASRKVEELRNENARLRELLMDRQRRLQSFKRLEPRDFPFRAIGARVKAYDSSSMRQSILVGVGTSDGAREGFAVTAAGALVGTLSEVGPWHSRVRLITDGKSRIPCRIQRTRTLSVLQGTGEASCTLDWVRRDAKLKSGDVLVTSPVDAILAEPPVLPPGIPAATILQARPGRIRPLFQQVIARPMVNVARLETVEVIIPLERAAQPEVSANPPEDG